MHIVAWVEHYDAGWWLPVAEVFLGSDVEMFQRMTSGGQGRQQASRGLPKEVGARVHAGFHDNPNSHTASWLTPRGFQHCLRKQRVPAEYKATLAFMERLGNSRLVFWFSG